MSELEPDYLAQCCDPKTPQEAREWFGERAKEARAEGCKSGRYTVHPQHGWLLVEAWKTPISPDKQGEPRWQLTRATQ